MGNSLSDCMVGPGTDEEGYSNNNNTNRVGKGYQESVEDIHESDHGSDNESTSDDDDSDDNDDSESFSETSGDNSQQLKPKPKTKPHPQQIRNRTSPRHNRGLNRSANEKPNNNVEYKDDHDNETSSSDEESEDDDDDYEQQQNNASYDDEEKYDKTMSPIVYSILTQSEPYRIDSSIQSSPFLVQAEKTKTSTKTEAKVRATGSNGRRKQLAKKQKQRQKQKQKQKQKHNNHTSDMTSSSSWSSSSSSLLSSSSSSSDDIRQRRRRQKSTSPNKSIMVFKEYRASALLIVPHAGILLLSSSSSLHGQQLTTTTTSNSPSSKKENSTSTIYQLPGGPIRKEDLDLWDSNLFSAAQYGLARILWEQTGIDWRQPPAFDRLAPLILHPESSKNQQKQQQQQPPTTTKSQSQYYDDHVLPNMYRQHLFFIAKLKDEDFEKACKDTNRSQNIACSDGQVPHKTLMHLPLDQRFFSGFCLNENLYNVVESIAESTTSISTYSNMERYHRSYQKESVKALEIAIHVATIHMMKQKRKMKERKSKQHVVLLKEHAEEQKKKKKRQNQEKKTKTENTTIPKSTMATQESNVLSVIKSSSTQPGEPKIKSIPDKLIPLNSEAEAVKELPASPSRRNNRSTESVQRNEKTALNDPEPKLEKEQSQHPPTSLFSSPKKDNQLSTIDSEAVSSSFMVSSPISVRSHASSVISSPTRLQRHPTSPTSPPSLPSTLGKYSLNATQRPISSPSKMPAIAPTKSIASPTSPRLPASPSLKSLVNEPSSPPQMQLTLTAQGQESMPASIFDAPDTAHVPFDAVMKNTEGIYAKNSNRNKDDDSNHTEDGPDDEIPQNNSSLALDVVMPEMVDETHNDTLIDRDWQIGITGSASSIHTSIDAEGFPQSTVTDADGFPTTTPSNTDIQIGEDMADIQNFDQNEMEMPIDVKKDQDEALIAPLVEPSLTDLLEKSSSNDFEQKEDHVNFASAPAQIRIEQVLARARVAAAAAIEAERDDMAQEKAAYGIDIDKAHRDKRLALEANALFTKTETPANTTNNFNDEPDTKWRTELMEARQALQEYRLSKRRVAANVDIVPAESLPSLVKSSVPLSNSTDDRNPDFSSPTASQYGIARTDTEEEEDEVFSDIVSEFTAATISDAIQNVRAKSSSMHKVAPMNSDNEIAYDHSQKHVDHLLSHKNEEEQQYLPSVSVSRREVSLPYDAKPSIINEHVLIMLLSTVSGKSNQKANQDRALMMLQACQIRPHIIDGSDINQKSFRDFLFATSEIRANYPQFFIVHAMNDGVVEGSYFNERSDLYKFVGLFETLEHLNDEGSLVKLFE